MDSVKVNQHPCLLHHNVVAALARPLQRLGVSFFGYTAVNSKNQVFSLGSKPDYAEQYLRLEQANNDIHYYSDSSRADQTYTFWDYKTLTKANKALYQMAYHYNQSHTLTIKKHTAEMTHCYHFSGANHDQGLNQRYVDNLDILHAYMDYFDRCAADIPEIAAIYRHPKAAIQTTQSTEAHLNDRLTVNMNPAYLNLPEIGQHELNFKGMSQYYLTENERRCLFWLYRGKPAEMIAEILGVSRKTIERYIAAIKQKYGCYTQFQLGAKIQESYLSEFL